MKKLGYIIQWLAAITLVTAHNLFALGGFKTMPLAFSVVAEEGDINQKLLSSLSRLEERMAKVASIEAAVQKNAADYEQVTKIVAEVQRSMLEVRKLQLESRSLVARRPGELSHDCARFMGGLYVLAAVKQQRLVHISEARALDIVKEYTGIEQKASLSTSDIPIPTQWGSEVVELVSQFGAARKWGTVFPLGAGVVKLPQLGTDTAFGLISASASVTAKSPSIVFVTFTPEKYGGLVTLPSEIDEDSIVAMGQFLGRYCARQMAKAEDTLFWIGNGSTHGDPEGLTVSTITNSKVVQMASTKTKYSDATLANLRAIRATVDAAALGTSAYYLHPSFEQHLAGLNSSGDKPYIANGINGASLDGFPIRWVDVMPAYSTSANASKVFALFGDASYQYLGVRKGMEVATSREAGFSTDEILVRALSRFTIGLMATGAVAGLETAAS
jgi:HK97 family phage major capsid protein